MLELFLSPGGRVGRLTYWLMALVNTIILFIGFALLIGFSALGEEPQGYAQEVNPLAMTGVIIFLLLMVIIMWSNIAMQIKRWHDRDKGAVWLLMNFVPLIGGLWVLIECGFLPGIGGRNRFGDPHGGAFAAAGGDKPTDWTERAIAEVESRNAKGAAAPLGSAGTSSAPLISRAPAVRGPNPLHLSPAQRGGFGRRGRTV